MRIGLFVGSFDPYTIGHDSIVKRALPLFDKIILWYEFSYVLTEMRQFPDYA